MRSVTLAGWGDHAIFADMEAGLRIRFDELGKRYDRRVIFKGLSGEAGPGSILVLTGPNGSGKSTLLAILTGLLRPTRGTVTYLEGERSLPRAEWRTRLGVVAPSMAMYEELDARENLEFFAGVRGLTTSRQEIDRQIAEVGLDPTRTTPVAGYSTGMQQRLKIAQAVLHAPDVLFLDEPGSNLDPAGRDWLEQWVSRIVGRGKTVVLATNDTREMKWGSQRVELVG